MARLSGMDERMAWRTTMTPHGSLPPSFGADRIGLLQSKGQKDEAFLLIRGRFFTPSRGTCDQGRTKSHL